MNTFLQKVLKRTIKFDEKALWKMTKDDLDALAVANQIDPTDKSTDEIILAFKSKNLVK